MKGWDLPKRDPRKEGSNLLIVDGMNLSFRYKHTGSTKFCAEYIKTVRSLAKSYSCADVVVLSDFKGSKYRKELFPEYKGNRDYSNQTEEEKARTEAFFEEYNKTIDTLESTEDINCLYHRGVEADDFATILVEELEESYDNIWLISTDGDWDELLSENVHRFAYTSRKEFFLDNFFEHHGCDTPDQFVMMKCLCGDTSDNIGGVSGMGIKRAYGVLRNFEDVFEIIDAYPHEGKQAYMKALNTAIEDGVLERNLELMDLRTFSRQIIEETDPEATNKVATLISKLPSGNGDFRELLIETSEDGEGINDL